MQSVGLAPFWQLPAVTVCVHTLLGGEYRREEVIVLLLVARLVTPSTNQVTGLALAVNCCVLVNVSAAKRGLTTGRIAVEAALKAMKIDPPLATVVPQPMDVARFD